MTITTISFRLPFTHFVPGDMSVMFARLDAVKFIGMTPTQWCIREGASCLAKDGEWEYEPQPSSRDADFIARTRFDSPEEAIIVVEKYLNK